MDSKVLFAGILHGKDKEHHVVDKCASVKNNRKTDYTCPTKNDNNNISIRNNNFLWSDIIYAFYPLPLDLIFVKIITIKYAKHPYKCHFR